MMHIRILFPFFFFLCSEMDSYGQQSHVPPLIAAGSRETWVLSGDWTMLGIAAHALSPVLYSLCTIEFGLFQDLDMP